MIRKTVAMSLILAAGICVYQGSSSYIEARMEQEHLKQAEIGRASCRERV